MKLLRAVWQLFRPLLRLSTAVKQILCVCCYLSLLLYATYTANVGIVVTNIREINALLPANRAGMIGWGRGQIDAEVSIQILDLGSLDSGSESGIWDRISRIFWLALPLLIFIPTSRPRTQDIPTSSKFKEFQNLYGSLHLIDCYFERVYLEVWCLSTSVKIDFSIV